MSRPDGPNAARRRHIKRQLATRDGQRCFYCAHPFADLAAATLDHLIPFSVWPTWQQANLVLACRPCNQAKGRQLPQVFLRPSGYRPGLVPSPSRAVRASVRAAVLSAVRPAARLLSAVLSAVGSVPVALPAVTGTGQASRPAGADLSRRAGHDGSASEMAPARARPVPVLVAARAISPALAGHGQAA